MAFRYRRAVLSGDDLRHGFPVRKRGGVQQRLREAIAHRRVHGLPRAGAVELCGVGTEFRDIATLEQRPDLARR